MHHVRMRFFNFVKEHDRIRPAAHRFGELTAFLVADVTRWRSNQARGGEFFHVLRHVDLNQCVAIAKHEFGQFLGEERLTHAGGSEENERADWTPRILQVGAAAAECFRNRSDRFVLTNHFAFQLLFHFQELLGFGLLHPLKRDAGHFRNDVHHVVRRNEHFLFFAFLAPFLQNGFEFFLCLLFLVAKGGCLFEILRFNCGLFLQSNLFDVLLHLFHVRWTRHRIDPGAGARFVHDIDRFVRQKTPGDITLGKFYGRLERFVRQFGFVVRFVLRTQSFQNLDRFVNCRRIHLHGLEPAL